MGIKSSHITRIMVLLLAMVGASAMAQVEIPDTAFLKYLKKDYSFVINANNKLIPSEALKVTSLHHSNANTKSIEGIQYFKNLQFLSVRTCKLKYVPNLDSLKSLKKLILLENELDSLPSLKALTKLSYLACYSNKIKHLPEFASNSPMDTLYLGINLFEEVEGVGDLVNLSDLGVWNCQLKRMPDLSRLTKLTALSLGTNHYLESLPGLSALSNLAYIDFDNNSFKELPNLNANTKLKRAKLQKNALTFEDILPYVSHPNFANFEYTPQDSVGVGGTFSIYEGQPFNYDLGIDPSLNTNTYRLYKNDVLIGTNSNGQLRINAVSVADQGVYRFEVANPALKNLVLQSRSIYLYVARKLDASAMTYTSKDINCNDLGTVKIQMAGIVGGVSPYRVQLIATSSTDTLVGSQGVFGDLKEEKYHVLIVDAKSNTLVLYDKIQLKANYENCDPLVITPNGDGNADELYIPISGKITVYNKQGLMVKEMNGPTYWNASDAKGETVSSGYYIISTAQQRIKVSVVW